MARYYDSGGNMNKELFDRKLKEIHDKIAFGDIGTLEELLKVRNKLRNLKYKYEKCGSRYIDCEAEIAALNEIIEETRRG